VTTVLLAEDDPAIAEPLSRALEREGYSVEVRGDGVDALERVLVGHVDLLVLDLGLPRMDGLEVCRRLRPDFPDLPVLMLTARTDEVDFVVGLDAGADDYVSKPFSMAELLARVQALLRRSGRAANVVHRVGDMSLVENTRTVTCNDVEIELTRIEFELLSALCRHQGQILSKRQLLRQVWDGDVYGDNVVEVHLSAVRRKLAAHGLRLIHTVRGVGYLLRA
jgi:DNA-binding response OmpR family regulator